MDEPGNLLEDKLLELSCCSLRQSELRVFFSFLFRFLAERGIVFVHVSAAQNLGFPLNYPSWRSTLYCFMNNVVWLFFSL